MQTRHPVLPFAAVLAAIALLSLMDALMKGASLAIGAYSTLLVRSVFGIALAGPIWLSTRTGWPQPHILRVHVLRGVVVTGVAGSVAIRVIENDARDFDGVRASGS